METELTYGQKAVWSKFNPSGNEDVDTIKQYYAMIIDYLNNLRTWTEDWEKNRLYSVAITEAQGAQMRAVKWITRNS